ncbi:MAG: peptide ABC transporter ATP-binding protein [Acidobacteria bacterium RIFCSPLOWO2_02_FULL_68_18]|nr:MAG: peptide ABC transporter ATP-binding protein [Acidobacteria bacterium RIFCSPLOWO2_02_FULL_68_18]OFW50228.1 MAG: peptide ABC transporter ATP-binding protein [Acidobacteria bacterium RIFCSPLOWO2_12_FULL_68_19]
MTTETTTPRAEDPAAPEVTPLLRIRGLRTHFYTEAGVARAVDGVDLDIMPGEVLGLVGESGSGKSVTALSILRLVPDPPGRIVGGEIWFGGRDLLALSWEEIRRVRGREISMIFQEPMTSLNPVFTIGSQVMEVILVHEPAVSRGEARRRAIQMLGDVGIPDAPTRMTQYPHELSGGMRQRVMIAIALALNPALLIADEPTTALDVTIQAQIVDLMLEMKARRETGAILLITHNLAVVAETCDRVAVMYGGKLQEIAPVRELFRHPLHPYTRGLLASLPQVSGDRASRLTTIPGAVPDIHLLPPGCTFSTRCAERFDPCRDLEPPLVEAAPSHWVRCHLHDNCHGDIGRRHP